VRRRLQPRLGRRFLARIELLEPLAPPGETDRAEIGVGAGGNDIGEREVECPQRVESGPDPRGKLLKRDLAVGIELSLSDR